MPLMVKSGSSFFAMQQDGGTLIYDLLTMEGATERLPLKNTTGIQNSTVPGLKNLS